MSVSLSKSVDNAPQQNAALGTTVLRVSAKDADSGTSGYVGYYMSGVSHIYER